MNILFFMLLVIGAYSYTYRVDTKVGNHNTNYTIHHVERGIGVTKE